MKSFIYFIVAFLFLTACSDNCSKTCKKGETAVEAVAPKPKNIILLIADGTGLSQVSVAQFYGEGTPNYERFPVIGLIKTSSALEKITDSAAGATAFANGVKTYNGAIGLDTDSAKVENMITVASNNGMQTGLIATSSITHATPACFYAYSVSRNNHEEIASYLPTSEVDFFAGAGSQYFNKREDNQNLFDLFETNGFTIDTTSLTDQPDAQKMGFLLSPKSMPTMLEGRGDFLPNATKLATTRLSKSEEGFFLMVEGSQVDWGGHENNAEYLIAELLDFDKTLGAVLDFAKENGETLIVVTADHETGGFSLSSNEDNYDELNPTFSTHGHSATMVPVFAFGPGSENFGGVYENTEIFQKIKALIQK